MKLSEKVSISIKNDIASGKLKKGEKIPAEPELMELYDVGRSTIREAIKSLAMSGILKVQQGFGTIVASKIKEEPLTQRLRRAEFDEINTVRALFEKEIVRLACSNHSDDDVRQLYHYLEQRQKAIETNQQKKCADADISFHICLARASGNKVLAELYENFSTVIRKFFRKRDQDNIGHFKNSQPLHEELAAAVAANNPLSAAQLLQRILDKN
jgi:DNA-binding FadR family transcriptional regulator